MSKIRCTDATFQMLLSTYLLGTKVLLYISKLMFANDTMYKCYVTDLKNKCYTTDLLGMKVIPYVWKWYYTNDLMCRWYITNLKYWCYITGLRNLIYTSYLRNNDIPKIWCSDATLQIWSIIILQQIWVMKVIPHICGMMLHKRSDV